MSHNFKRVTTTAQGSGYSRGAWVDAACLPNASRVHTVTWQYDAGIASTMFGFSSAGKFDGYCVFPNFAQRIRGVSPATDAAPEPVFGGVSMPTVRAEWTPGRRLEMTYDAAAGEIRGRFPDSEVEALRASCVLFRNVPCEPALVPCVYIGEAIGIAVSICD